MSQAPQLTVEEQVDRLLDLKTYMTQNVQICVGFSLAACTVLKQAELVVHAKKLLEALMEVTVRHTEEFRKSVIGSDMERKLDFVLTRVEDTINVLNAHAQECTWVVEMARRALSLPKDSPLRQEFVAVVTKSGMPMLTEAMGEGRDPVGVEEVLQRFGFVRKPFPSGSPEDNALRMLESYGLVN